MKKILLVVIIIMSVLNVNSQEIVNSAKLWSIAEEHCQSWGSSYSTDFISFDEDTIINDTAYRKVWIAEDENHEEWNFYGAFIREDEGLVFYRQLFEDEGLIYDFNMEIGDSAVIDNPRTAGPVTLVLDAIDSITLEDGILRERWKLTSSEYSNYEYWIRGIGSQTGVINSSTGVYGGLCGSYTLLCESENDFLYYMNDIFETCFLIVTDVNDFTEETSDLFVISEYGNFDKLIAINTNEKGKSRVIISNLWGSIISDNIVNSNLYSFSFMNYSPGIYVVTVINNSNLQSKKIIIK